MAISRELKALSNKLQKASHSVLERAEGVNGEVYSDTLDAIAKAAAILDRASFELEGKEPGITEETLETLKSLADAMDESGDEFLIKKASVLDDLLFTICKSKDSFVRQAAGTEDEMTRLYNEFRAKQREHKYVDPKQELDTIAQKKEISKAVKDQVKEYRPLEAPLLTRQCPDHPGAMLGRIADQVYQCPLDHKVYNYMTGFTTEKGNKIRGGSVENQTAMYGQRNITFSPFDTRETAMMRFASENAKSMPIEIATKIRREYRYAVEELLEEDQTLSDAKESAITNIIDLFIEDGYDPYDIYNAARNTKLDKRPWRFDDDNAVYKKLYVVMTYGDWGSEPYTTTYDLEEAKTKAQKASLNDPTHEYGIELQPGGAAYIYKGGDLITSPKQDKNSSNDFSIQSEGELVLISPKNEAVKQFLMHQLHLDFDPKALGFYVLPDELEVITDALKQDYFEQDQASANDEEELDGKLIYTTDHNASLMLYTDKGMDTAKAFFKHEPAFKRVERNNYFAENLEPDEFTRVFFMLGDNGLNIAIKDENRLESDENDASLIPEFDRANKTINVNVPKNLPNAERQKIINDIKGTYGDAYTIILKDASTKTAYPAFNSSPGVKMTAGNLPVDFSDAELEELVNLADKYESARILFEEWDDQGKSIPELSALDALRETARESNGNLGVIPGSSPELIAKLNLLWDEAMNASDEDDDDLDGFEDEEEEGDVSNKTSIYHDKANI